MNNKQKQCTHPSRQAGDIFCVDCGQRLATIIWQLVVGDRTVALDGPIANDRIEVSAGDTVLVCAISQGATPVAVRIETESALQSPLQREEDGRTITEWQLTVQVGKQELKLHSEDGPRPKDEWWLTAEWRLTAFVVSDYLKLVSAEWRLGVAETLDFYADVRTRRIMIWNDAPNQRLFTWRLPEGFKAQCEPSPTRINETTDPPTTSLERKGSFAIPPEGSALLTVEDLRRDAERHDAPEAKVWLADTEVPIVYHRIFQKPKQCYDAVIAIDFGTRNTGLRYMWLDSIVHSDKRPSKVPQVFQPEGEAALYGRFPSQMVFHKSGSLHAIGSMARDLIEKGEYSDEYIPLDDLKTILRNKEASTILKKLFDSPDTQKASDLPSDLLGRYFQKLLNMVRGQMQARLGDDLPINQLRIAYVVCHPVLDGGDEQKRYRGLLTKALNKAGVKDGIDFRSESDAAILGLLSRAPEIFKGMEGSTIAIADSGGGTTDVTWGILKLQDGGYRLEDARSTVLRLHSNELANESRNLSGEGSIDAVAQQYDHEFGGNLLDMALAHYLTDQHWQKNPLLTWEGEDHAVPPTDIEIFKSADATIPRLRVTNLARARELKEAVNRDQNVKMERFDPRMAGFQLIINDYRNLVTDKILAFAYVPEDFTVNKVICVGGTSKDERVKQLITERLGGISLETPIPDELLFTSVVEGAARMIGYTENYAPLSLAIALDGATPLYEPDQTVNEREIIQQDTALPPPGFSQVGRITVQIPENRLWRPALIGYFAATGAARNAPAQSETSPPPEAVPMMSFPAMPAFPDLSMPVPQNKATPMLTETPHPADHGGATLAIAHIDGRQYGGKTATLTWRITMEQGAMASLHIPALSPELPLWIVPLVPRAASLPQGDNNKKV